MRTLSTYRQILRKKGFYTCLQELKKAIWPIWWTHNRTAIEHIQAERCAAYLRRNYLPLIKKQPLPPPISELETKTPTIWICWLQGKDAMPPIVHRCYQSIQHYASNYTIQLLDQHNLLNYVSLPEHILRKYHQGKITFTHFSDILRTAILVEHGGIWLDATVLLTNSLPKYIQQEPLFMYRTSVLQHMPHATSSWLIAAQKGHPILRRLLELLYTYWERENKLHNYFLFHIFLYLLVTENTEAATLFSKMPYIPNVEAHTLQFELFNPYHEQEYRQITTRSTVHKLTWKFKPEQLNNIENTYYDHILHHLHLQ